MELEAKYEALLKKQQGRAYIAEGKSWYNTDEDEPEEYGNFALMANSNEESSGHRNEVPTLTTVELSSAQYKRTVEEMT